MSDRSWAYSRSYGSSSSGTNKPYTSSYSTGTNNYTRSGEKERSRDRSESSYTRSSSNTSYQSRDPYHYRNDSRSSSTTFPGSYSRNSRDTTNVRYYHTKYDDDRSIIIDDDDDDDEPIITYEKPARKNDRSPTAYMNRSPPPHSSFVRSSDTSKSRDRSPPSNRMMSTKTDSSSRFDRKETPDDPHNPKPVKYGVGIEVVKLMERLKEYVPWLTARKTAIFEQHRDKELKDEVDDIDWCLDVIEDIKADENVGMHTIKRAQEMVMRLITKAPLSTPRADSPIEEVRVEGVLRDDIYSARSPSPPAANDSMQFSRRNEFAESNPRVIPTDRSEMIMVGSSPGIPGRSYVINPLAVRPDKFPYNQPSVVPDQPAAMAKVDRLYPIPKNTTSKQSESFLATQRKSQDPNFLQTGITAINRRLPELEVQSSLPKFEVREFQGQVERGKGFGAERIYEYGHGQPESHKDDSLFERRKRNNVPQGSIDSNLIHGDTENNRNKKVLEDEDMRRRMREWEEDSEEDEILIIRKGKKTQDQDMRVYVAESRPRTHRSGEEIRSPEPEDTNEFNRFEFGRDTTNRTTLQPKSIPVNIPVQPQGLIGIQQAPIPIPTQNQSQPQNNNVPVQLMNMNPQMFNPFLNPAMANLPGMTATNMTGIPPTNLPGMAASFLQNQAQMFVRYPSQNNPGRGLLPLPMTGNSQPGFRFPSPAPVTDLGVGLGGPSNSKELPSNSSSQSNVQTQEELMLSRIKARAAESFSRKGGRPDPLNQEATPGSLQSSLDPRLKPRPPRDFPRDPRRHANDEDPRSRKNFSHPTERSRHDDVYDKDRRGDDRRNEDNYRYRSHYNRDKEDIRPREPASPDPPAERVKINYINPPIDRVRRNSGDRRERRYSGEDRQERHRRVSGEKHTETTERVDRYDKKGQLENKTDRYVQEEPETVDRVARYPSLSARIQAVRDKLNQNAMEKQVSSTQSRLDEIRREAEEIHSIGGAISKKSKSDPNAPTSSQNTVESEKPKKGKRGRASSNSSDDVAKPKTPRTATLKSNIDKGDASGVTLRRSPRIKPQTEKEENRPNVTKTKNSSKRSPTKSLSPSEPETSSGGGAYRIPRLKKPTPPAEEPQDDSDDELKLTIDDSQVINDENPFHDDDTFQRSPSKEKVALVEADEPSTAKSTLQTNSDTKSSLPAGTDELLKSLLFSSLNAEEAEVLKSSEDYLASTLARLKEELSRKVKEKAKQAHLAGESAESAVSSTSTDKIHSTASDSKDDEDKQDESASRGRTLSRKKPQAKRRSSLEKLHDALREMNFDSMMPLGPRRTQTKLAQEELQAEQGKSGEALPKLTPIVVLENVNQVASNQTPEFSDNQGQGAKKGLSKKRKAGTKKGQNSVVETEDDLSIVDPTETPNITPPNKKQKTIRGGVVIGPNDLIVNEGLSKIKLESDYVPIKTEMDSEEAGDKRDPLGSDIDADEAFDFEENGLDFEDYEIPENFTVRTCADDFVIKDLELVNLEVTDSKPPFLLQQTSKDENDSEEPQSELKKRGRKKKPEVESLCHLCPFSGKKVVVHYVNKHPGMTIPAASISEAAFKTLQGRNKSDSPQLMEIEYNRSDAIRCVFCNTVLPSISIYCNHLTNHTGEFRFNCSICNIKFSNKPSAAAHCKTHKKDNVELSESLVETKVPMEDGENEFYAYLCRECNYFQINSGNIRQHLDFTKHSENDIVCIKFKGTPIILEFQEDNKKPLSRKVFEELPPLPLQECNKPVFFPPELSSLKAPNLPSTNIRRFICGKKTRLDSLLEHFPPNPPEVIDMEEVSTPVYKLEEPDEAIMVATKDTLQWIVDAISCPEEFETEVANLKSGFDRDERSSLCEEIESQFDWDEVYSDEELEWNPTDDDEPNDFFLKPSDEDTDTVDTTVEVEKTENGSGLISIKSLLDSSLTSPEHVFSPMSPPRSNPLYISSPPWDLSPVCESESRENINEIENLEGIELYRCANNGCYAHFDHPDPFKVHVTRCVVGLTSGGRKNSCFHCDKSFKNAKSLVDHIDAHGRRVLGCAICSYRARTVQDMNRHYKVIHKIIGCKGHTINSSQLNSLWYPKEVYLKKIDPKQMEECSLLYIPRPQFQPDEIEDIPKQCILASEIHCALCKYSTRVRVNMIRHLNLHKEADENGTTLVPVEAPVNPVPWLERKELMFDKMINLAGSSHAPKEIAVDKETLPQFVEEQFRYVCSVIGCEQVTVDDSLLRSHMKALHSEIDYYACPICTKNEFTRQKFIVPIDKIGIHLKLHGPKLLKCGHCDFINTQTKQMEKHVAEKHIEKKPIHYVIRNIGDEGSSGSSRRTSIDESIGRGFEKWKCGSCKFISPTWEGARDHCRSIHGMKDQFMCDSCTFSTNSFFQVMSHMSEKFCAKSVLQPPFILVNFARADIGEDKARYLYWRRPNEKDHLRGIFFLHESDASTGSTPTPSTSSNAKPMTSKGTPILFKHTKSFPKILEGSPNKEKSENYFNIKPS